MAYDDPASADAEELALPMLPPGSVTVFNAFYRRREPLNAQLGVYSLAIEPRWDAGADSTTGCTVRLEIDGEEGELRVPGTLLDLLLSGIEDAPALASLPPAHAGIVLEFALSEPLQAVEAQFGCRISVSSVSTGTRAEEDPVRPPLSFALTIDGLGAAWSELRLIPSQAKRLAEYLDRTAGRASAKLNLPFTASLLIGSVTLTADEIASLSPGDVVLADHICPPDAAILVIADHLGAPVSLTAEGVRLTSAPAPLRGSGWEWATGGETQAAMRGAGQAGGAGGIPIRLTFELSRTELSFQRLEKLTAGEMLPFRLAAGAALDIVAGGRLIGKGGVIDVGVSRGVRIVRLSDGKIPTVNGRAISGLTTHQDFCCAGES